MTESTSEKAAKTQQSSEPSKVKRLNLFATILTYAAPSANHHNKGDDNNKVLQTISKQGRDYATISPYAVRDALRRIFQEEGLSCNRKRVHTAGAPMVEYQAFPNAEEYIDDFFFGFCVTDKKAIAANPDLPSKRDAIFRNNMAVGLSSNINVHLQQAPRNTANSPWNNIRETTLLYRQVSYTAYQYPFALSRSDCISQPDWTKALIKAIAQLSEVAGGKGISYIQMCPRSIMARLTPRRVPGYDTYGFNEEGEFTELDRLIDRELPGDEFWLGGEIVRQMPQEIKQKLETNKVHLHKNPETLLEEISQQFLAEDNNVVETLWLRIRAPFASFSYLRTGTYRDTMPIMPPSAAYGLILNLAGIEMRGSLKKSITPIRSDLPNIKLAFGRVAGSNSKVSIILQNMHSYPIGQIGKERKAKTYGNKYWIEPTYREIIVNLDMMLGVQADSELISQVRKGLNGEGDRPFYGFPFAGDNNFLFDRIDCLERPLSTHWFVRSDSNLELEPGAISLTVEIDRQNPSQTKSFLFSATQNPLTSLPNSAWLSIFEPSQ